MKLPRDIDGHELVKRLRRHGYEVVHQTGSHIRLESTAKDSKHRITVPKHHPLKVGTLSAIVKDVASHLQEDPERFSEDLFG